jgi:hypothetical protein
MGVGETLELDDDEEDEDDTIDAVTDSGVVVAK